MLAYYQGKANKASAICPVVLDSSLKAFSSINLEHLHQQNRNL
jgi:hypothetical protein